MSNNVNKTQGKVRRKKKSNPSQKYTGRFKVQPTIVDEQSNSNYSSSSNQINTSQTSKFFHWKFNDDGITEEQPQSAVDVVIGSNKILTTPINTPSNISISSQSNQNLNGNIKSNNTTNIDSKVYYNTHAWVESQQQANSQSFFKSSNQSNENKNSFFQTNIGSTPKQMQQQSNGFSSFGGSLIQQQSPNTLPSNKQQVSTESFFSKSNQVNGANNSFINPTSQTKLAPIINQSMDPYNAVTSSIWQSSNFSKQGNNFDKIGTINVVNKEANNSNDGMDVDDDSSRQSKNMLPPLRQFLTEHCGMDGNGSTEHGQAPRTRIPHGAQQLQQFQQQFVPSQNSAFKPPSQSKFSNEFNHQPQLLPIHQHLQFNNQQQSQQNTFFLRG